MNANTFFGSGQIFILLLAVGLMHMGCARPTASASKCGPIPRSDHPPSIPTNELQVDIYLDATLSMQGFAQTESFSRYQQTIPILESSVINSLRGSKKFFRFGNRTAELFDRSFLSAQKPGFYADSGFNTRTFIENVLDKAEIDHLTVVVTDLFQDNADVNLLSEKIKQKFIVNDKAVGILAIRSEFNGSVYDVGANNYTFPYRTSEQVTFRPFYILALGGHADIARYFDALESSGLLDASNHKRVIFSKYITVKPSDLQLSETEDKKNLNELSSTLLKSDGKESSGIEFRVRDGKKPAQAELKLPFQPLPDSVSIGNGLRVESIQYVCRSVTQDDGSVAAVFEPSKVEGGIHFSGGVQPDSVRLKMEISPERFESDKVYAFHTVLHPGNSTLPGWVEEWDLTDSEIESMRRSIATFDGTRTYNLKRFLQSLLSTNNSVHEPKLGDFYFYLKPD